MFEDLSEHNLRMSVFLLGFRVSCLPGLLAGYSFAVLFGGMFGLLAALLSGRFAGLHDGHID